ncbi:hypothetical protein ANO11243_012200 [Dothideomycetidae sp. 11243]|nr:hypothetical protein ANO11243_012200 [fungal sp. No.11243]
MSSEPSGVPIVEQELENFRRQWKEEVSARSTRPGQHNPGESATWQQACSRQSTTSIHPRTAPQTTPSQAPLDPVEGHTCHDLPDEEENLKLGAIDRGLSRRDLLNAEPQTALEHYEKAVENETAGKLGESLRLYRRAFKLDDKVHEKYKNKHFPPSAHPPRPSQHHVLKSAEPAPHTLAESTHGLPPTIAQLIQEFSSLSIPSAEPPTDASPRPPCPIAELPEEILTQVLYHLACNNVANFARTALVCKRLAYLVMSEERIWKAVTMSKTQGFGGMHYDFVCDVFGKNLFAEEERVLDGTYTSPDVMKYHQSRSSSIDASSSLLVAQYSGSWRQMFRTRPRIRFHGVYISTVNYTRPGAASTTINTWTTPVHVVTYYRYLRFFRDGTCISLLTTAEPTDVVHILAKENMPEVSSDPSQSRRTQHVDRNQVSRPPQTSLEKGGSSHAAAQRTEQPHALPSSQIMKDALRGRWRLSGPGNGESVPESQHSSSNETEAEGDLHIETEGVIPKYMFKMQFQVGALQNVGSAVAKKGSRNNRLTWKGFWSYNRLTDDWAEFGLKNDKSFFFSRVKSYGMGN